MPTGYTAAIHDGKETTFTDYAMGCARAFGALIELRDEPADAPIPGEFTPSPYYREQLDAARRRLADIEAWTTEQADAEAARNHAGEVRRATERRQEMRALRERYEVMLMQAEAWQPPTPEHVEFAKFMVSQLRDSIKHDCYDIDMPEPVSGEEYKTAQLAHASHMVGYYEQQMNDEAERAHGRTEWVRALRASLSADA